MRLLALRAVHRFAHRIFARRYVADPDDLAAHEWRDCRKFVDLPDVDATIEKRFEFSEWVRLEDRDVT